RLLGVSDVVPFVLTCISALGLLIGARAILEAHPLTFRGWYPFFVLLGVAFLTPVPALVFSGHEHLLHGLLTLLFVHLSAGMLSSDRRAVSRQPSAVRGTRDRPEAARAEPPRFVRSVTANPLTLAPLLTATRYEGLFLVFAV